MKPSPEQLYRIREAMANSMRLPRTPGAKLRDAIQYTKKPDAVTSNAEPGSQSSASRREQYTPHE